MMSSTTYSDDSSYKIQYPKQLQQQIDLAIKSKGFDYKPRTRHIEQGHPSYTNRLILTDSPYLLQHAHNPVNWFSWGEEAFATAKRENKPIFLSIGYATCHWCHVMEEESFESIQVAKILNEHFIAIKVDREQHPDIDATYMNAVILLKGQGGWPMSTFLTAEGKPFYGGTYYPQPTFIDLLLQVKSAWDKQHQTVLAQANRLSDAIQQQSSRQDTVKILQQTTVQLAVQQILRGYDEQYGGFSQAPKFPNEPSLLLLLQSAERGNYLQLVEPLNKTLLAMAQGGIYDQVGGGFHRYSTDTLWLVPHFEKMLYNQAYMVRVYAQAYRLTLNPLYARIVRQTLDYVIRDMSNANGVFYSATDADSEGEEGTYFVWTVKEINKILNADDATFIIQLFGLKQQGNFEGKNIFSLAKSLQETAKQQNKSLNSLLTQLDPLLDKLRNHRNKRIPPLTDDKIIVAWNGMLITALAEAGDILNEPRYINAAKTAGDFLWKAQRTQKGGLWRINLNNKSSIPAKQSDYAHFSEALLALYDVTSDQTYLQKAKELANEMVEKFMDSKSGVLVMGQDPLLFTQPKDAYDSALPSGNSVAVRVFNRLFNRTGEDLYSQYATQIFQTFSSRITHQPASYAYMLAQLDEMNKGEINAYQYAARSAVKVDAKIEQVEAYKYKLNINFKIKPGWHINSNKPLQQQLIATSIKVVANNSWQLTDIKYPQPELIKTNFNKEILSLFQGDFNVVATLTATAEYKIEPLKINLGLQACNKDSCLAPESLILYLNPIEKP